MTTRRQLKKSERARIRPSGRLDPPDMSSREYWAGQHQVLLHQLDSLCTEWELSRSRFACGFEVILSDDDKAFWNKRPVWVLIEFAELASMSDALCKRWALSRSGFIRGKRTRKLSGQALAFIKGYRTAHGLPYTKTMQAKDRRK